MPLVKPANCRRIDQRNTDTENGFLATLGGMITVLLTTMTGNVSNNITVLSGNVAVTANGKLKAVSGNHIDKLSGSINPDSGNVAASGGKVSGKLNSMNSNTPAGRPP